MKDQQARETAAQALATANGAMKRIYALADALGYFIHTDFGPNGAVTYPAVRVYQVDPCPTCGKQREVKEQIGE